MTHKEDGVPESVIAAGEKRLRFPLPSLSARFLSLGGQSETHQPAPTNGGLAIQRAKFKASQADLAASKRGATVASFS